MKYEGKEMYRNEAIVEILKEMDEFYSGADIVDLVGKVRRFIPETDRVYKVSINPKFGYVFEKYYSIEDVKDILEKYLITDSINLALAQHTYDIYKERI